jgi:hypothetical protein
MKSTIKILTILLVLMISSVIFPKQAPAQQTNVSFQVFYDQLSPYGQWVNYPNYGYVWIPDAGPDFVPYSTGGHWILTDYGWTWVSDYSWGWAPFHYGRWDYDHYYGWLWIPDNEWGPAWVTWRRADGYYGWEPMEPGISISVSFGRAYDSHHDHWMFVRDRDFERSDINHYYVNRTERDRIIRNSTVINKTYVDNRRHTTYVSGPARADVQKVTGRRITPVAIQDNNKPGQNMSNGQLRIYRPQVNKNIDKGKKPAPSRVTNLKEVKPPSERKAVNQPRNVNPQYNNKKEVQKKAPMPANAKSKAQPSQPQKPNHPSMNRKREQQPNAVKSQGNNNAEVQPSKPRNVTPPNNNRKEQQPNMAKPQNNSNNTKAQPEQPKNTQPADNRREQQQGTVRPQNNNMKAQPSQSRNVTPSNNNGRAKQPNAVKPSNNSRNEQPKESRPEPDKQQR